MPVDMGPYGHLDLRFDDLSDSIALAERLLDQHLQDFEARVDQIANDLADHDLENLYLEKIWLTNQFPQVLRRALLVVCYSRIGTLLEALCHTARKQHDLPLPLKALKPGGIEQAKTYLTKLAGLTQPFQTPQWSLLVNGNRLRNSIVHANGRVPFGSEEEWKRTDKLCSFVETEPLLTIDEFGYIAIERGFCEKVVEAAHHFFTEFPRTLTVEAWRYGVSENRARKAELERQKQHEAKKKYGGEVL